MAFDYAALASKVETTIADFGQLITLYNPPTGSIDSDEPWKDPVAFDTSTATADEKVETPAVWIEPNDGIEYKDTTGGLIERGKAGFLISGKVGKPIEKFSSIDDNGEFWRIVKINKLKPGGTILLYGVEVTQ